MIVKILIQTLVLAVNKPVLQITLSYSGAYFPFMIFLLADSRITLGCVMEKEGTEWLHVIAVILLFGCRSRLMGKESFAILSEKEEKAARKPGQGEGAILRGKINVLCGL